MGAPKGQVYSPRGQEATPALTTNTNPVCQAAQLYTGYLAGMVEIHVLLILEARSARIEAPVILTPFSL